MARVARHFSPHFVISTGDNFYEDGVTAPSDPLWQESFEAVYEAPSLQVPWYVVLGNHDYRGSVRAHRIYAENDTRWTFPDRYYTVRHPVGADTDVQFIFLDTTPFLNVYKPGGDEFTPGVAEQNTDAQLHWLNRTLEHSPADWKFVVGHHPLVSGSQFHGGTQELRNAVAPLLHQHGVHAYFCGHEHDLQHLDTGDGLHHFVSGAGSEVRETSACPHTRFCQSAPGFATVAVSRDQLRVAFYDHEANRLYRTTRQRTQPSSPPCSTPPPSFTVGTRR